MISLGLFGRTDGRVTLSILLALHFLKLSTSAFLRTGAAVLARHCFTLRISGLGQNFQLLFLADGTV